MAVKNYGIFDKWLNSEQQNVVDVKSTDGVINSVKVNGQEYGGGGSSDFSTAKITVVGDCTLLGAFSTSIEMDEVVDTTVFISEFLEGSPYDVILYKGTAIIRVQGGTVASTSGDIQLLEDDMYIVTGDCTITVS